MYSAEKYCIHSRKIKTRYAYSEAKSHVNHKLSSAEMSSLWHLFTG